MWFVRHVPRQGRALLIQIAHHPCMHMHGRHACRGALPPLGRSLYRTPSRWPQRSRKLTGTQRGGRPRSTTISSSVYYFTLFKVLSRCRSRKLTGTERGARSRSTTASSHVFYFTLFKVLSRCRSRKLADTERGGRPRSTTASSHVFLLYTL